MRRCRPPRPWWCAAFNGRTIEWGEGCCCRCGQELRQASTRRDHPRSLNPFSPPTGVAVYRGNWTRALKMISTAASIAAVFVNSKERMRGGRAPCRYLPLSTCACARALCSRESLLVPAGPLHQRRLPRLLRLYAETFVIAGGLGEECTHLKR